MPKRTDIQSILILGAGPIVIGQACEFDYSGAQACKALREEGYRVILVNSNPATIMTDPAMADLGWCKALIGLLLNYDSVNRERCQSVPIFKAFSFWARGRLLSVRPVSSTTPGRKPVRHCVKRATESFWLTRTRLPL